MYHNTFSLKYLKLKISAVIFRLMIYARRGTQRYLRSRPMQPEVTRETIHVPSRDSSRTINVDMYRPSHIAASVQLPVLINWHGSGYLIPSWGEDREWIVQAAKALECCVLDCDYRKAPEYPYPCGLNDADDVVNWALSQPSRFDVSKVSLSGFSAGGAFALSCSNFFGSEKIKSVFSLYPPVNFDQDSGKALPDPLPPFRSGLILPLKVVDLFDKAYSADWPAPKPDRLTIGGLDPDRFSKHIFLACGDADTLLNGSRNFAEKMKKHGHKDISYVTVEKEAHAWDKNPLCPESIRARDDVYRQAIDTIRRSWT